jgi:LDH2 family malate/lactate/ureidoglycolate dehydrogenase
MPRRPDDIRSWRETDTPDARAARVADGIEIDDTTWAQLAAIAERYQIRVE